MDKKKVFLLDDEQDMLDTISDVLMDEFEVVTEINPLVAVDFLKLNKFDAILLDINMPQMDGFEVYKQLSMSVDLSRTAVMFLSSIVKVQTKVDGLELGADDYILKPVLSRELIARLNNRIKKVTQSPPNILMHGTVRINADIQRVDVNGEMIDLTPIEYRIFYLLWKNLDKIVSKEEISLEIWPLGNVTHHTIDTHFSNLRKKFTCPSVDIRVIKSCGVVLSLRL